MVKAFKNGARCATHSSGQVLSQHWMGGGRKRKPEGVEQAEHHCGNSRCPSFKVKCGVRAGAWGECRICQRVFRCLECESVPRAPLLSLFLLFQSKQKKEKPLKSKKEKRNAGERQKCWQFNLLFQKVWCQSCFSFLSLLKTLNVFLKGQLVSLHVIVLQSWVCALVGFNLQCNSSPGSCYLSWVVFLPLISGKTFWSVLGHWWGGYLGVFWMSTAHLVTHKKPCKECW